MSLDSNVPGRLRRIAQVHDLLLAEIERRQQSERVHPNRSAGQRRSSQPQGAAVRDGTGKVQSPCLSFLK